jgi:hypothetical protein
MISYSTTSLKPEVELTGQIEPFNLSMQEVPGVGIFSVNMNNDDFQTLRDQVNDAWLNAQGLELWCTTVEGIFKDDIIPGFGKVRDWHWTDTGMQAANIYFEGSVRITVPANVELTVHRVIQ